MVVLQEIDQLHKIFQVLGTPTESLWPGVTQNYIDFKDTFPKWWPKPFNQVSLLIVTNDTSILASSLNGPVEKMSAQSEGLPQTSIRVWFMTLHFHEKTKLNQQSSRSWWPEKLSHGRNKNECMSQRYEKLQELLNCRTPEQWSNIAWQRAIIRRTHWS